MSAKMYGFDEYHGTIEKSIDKGEDKYQTKPFIFKKNDNTFVFLLMRQNPDAIVKSTVKCFNCLECRKRVISMSQYIPKSGDMLPIIDTNTEFPKYTEISKQIRTNTSLVVGIKIITNSMLFPKYEGSSGGTQWIHLNTYFPEISTISTNQVHGYEKTVHKYIPLIKNTFCEIVKITAPNTLKKLGKFLSLLDKIHYGDRLTTTLEWLIKYIPDYDTLTGNMLDIRTIEAILSAGYLPGSNVNDPVIPIYHTVNNTIKMLLEYIDKPEAEFIKQVETLLNPENYQRRDTTNVSTSSQSAMSTALGEFTNSVMTIDQAIQLYGAKKVIHRDHQVSSMSVEVANTLPTKMSELLNIENITNLEVNVNSINHIVVACETDLGPRVRYPFLWSFLNNTSPKTIGLTGWVKVRAILKLPHGSHNYIFICGCTTDIFQSLKTYCCIEEFLEHSLVRIHGSAFASLNQQKHLNVPKELTSTDLGVVGVGICISKMDDYIQPILLRMDSKEFTIAKY